MKREGGEMGDVWEQRRRRERNERRNRERGAGEREEAVGDAVEKVKEEK